MDINSALYSEKVALREVEIPSLSIVVITKNEEANLPRFFCALPRVGEVVVVDSESSDATRAIAEAHGARVVSHPFRSYAEQKNKAIELAKYPWILSLDADEVPDVFFWKGVAKNCVRAPERVVGFRVCRRLVFMGKRLRFGRSADYPVRLVRRSHAVFKFDIHEKMVPEGLIETIRGGWVDHYSYANIGDYFERLNRYTTIISANKPGSRGPLRKLMVGLRFWVEFLNRYFLRLGLLDGFPGYTYALYSSIYAFTKYTKAIEQTDGRPS